ncbi:MAG: ATP synthase F1 subunit gamma, partial [Bacteroidales bacterium]|nr:ATP synthase F1 subunit gamma [Bacteroidales bacterium]
ISESIREDENNPFIVEKETEKVLLIVITSNKGLCGAFNSSVIKRVNYMAEEKYAEQKSRNNLHLLIIGKKAFDHFKKRDLHIIQNRSDMYDKLSYENVSLLAGETIERFVRGEYDRIEIVYNQFMNAAVQRLMEEQFLPLIVEEQHEERVKSTYTDYIFEPSKEYIIQELVPGSLKLQLFKAILDSHASEHGARMTAMHKATDNATELIKNLKLEYNKARQASITNEILEIVSGANALRG